MKVLLAVSGGIDSMTMADIMFSHSCLYDATALPCEHFNAVGDTLYEEVAIAHCNFHLRPGDCDLDEQLVEEWSRARALTFYKKDFDTEAYAKEHGVSIEMAARELRYAWFLQLCQEHGYDALAVAHNANDNAETLLLNLVRGTGLRGLCGMSTSRSFAAADSSATAGEVAIIRPLLGMTRAEIEAYATEHNVPYRTDKTNLECEYKRNKLRNQVLPLMAEMNPSVIRTLNRNMEHFSAASAIIDNWCAEHRSVVMGPSSTPGAIADISIPSLLCVNHWEYLLFDILDSYGFTPSAIDDVTRLVQTFYGAAAVEGETFSGKTFHSFTHTLVTASDRLILSRSLKDSEANTYMLEIETVPYHKGMSLVPEKGTLYCDADLLPADAIVRDWQPGDWLVPFGMKGKKKVSDLFTDLHLDLLTKQSMRVLAPADPADHHVYAVLGLRIDDSLKVTTTTRSLAILR